MTFTEQTQLANDPQFIQRVRQAAVSAALAVASEAASGNDGLDRGRQRFATAVLRDPLRYARMLSYGVVTYTTLKPDSSDTVLANALSALWNAYAGVNPGYSEQ